MQFSKLREMYPTAARKDLFNSMGGQWPSLINDPNYENSCGVRLSLALLGAGASIAPKFKEANTGDGRPIILKVATMRDYL